MSYLPIAYQTRKRMVMVLSAFAALVVGGQASALACSASPGQFLRLQNAYSGFYLAVSGGHARQGADIIQWADEGQRDVHWVLERSDANAYKVRNSASGLYLAVSGGHVRQGAEVVQWSDVGQRNIKWEFLSTPDGSCKLRNINSGLYLAVSGGRANQGADVVQWSDVGQGDIVWRIR